MGAPLVGITADNRDSTADSGKFVGPKRYNLLIDSWGRGNRGTYLTPLEHQEVLLTLREGARRRILARTRHPNGGQLLRPLPRRPGI